jgi:copper(I)-binding protein
MKKQVAACVLTMGGMVLAGSATAHGEQAGMAGAMMMSSGHAHPDTAAGDAPVSKTLSVSDCWVRALPDPAPSAGYFVVKNSGHKADQLKGASSPAFGMVMLHQTTESGGMSKMAMVHDIAVAAGGTLEFKPGSYHAMLEKPIGALVVGSQIKMDFLFGSGEKASAMCQVKPANAASN